MPTFNHHFVYGKAKTVISSDVNGAPARPPPVPVTTMYCLPSFPKYVLGTDETEPFIFTVHNSLPVFASKARKRESSVAPMKTRPPAVAIDPPILGRPVFCFSGGRLSVTPRGTFQAISPVLTL